MASLNEVLELEKLIWEAVAKSVAVHLATATDSEVLLTMPSGPDAAKALIAAADPRVDIVLGADGICLKARP